MKAYKEKIEEKEKQSEIFHRMMNLLNDKYASCNVKMCKFKKIPYSSGSPGKRNLCFIALEEPSDTIGWKHYRLVGFFDPVISEYPVFQAILFEEVPSKQRLFLEECQILKNEEVAAGRAILLAVKELANQIHCFEIRGRFSNATHGSDSERNRIIDFYEKYGYTVQDDGTFFLNLRP